MAEFFGIGGFQRSAEGFFSWQHLLFVTSLMVIMAVAAAYLGRRNRNRTEKEKNRVLIVAAILINAFELIKIIAGFVDVVVTNENPDELPVKLCIELLYALPLFLCSIQLITIPLAAFTRGRVKEASLDFVSIFGMLGALLGTYAATQNYNAYPVLSGTNVISGITHAISGFAALYIMISGMMSMKRKNIGITFTILLAFCAAAYAVNLLIAHIKLLQNPMEQLDFAAYLSESYNFMFIMRSDGTPYVIVENLVGGSPVLYPMLVVLLFLVYIAAFYGVYYLIRRRLDQSRSAELSA